MASFKIVTGGRLGLKLTVGGVEMTTKRIKLTCCPFTMTPRCSGLCSNSLWPLYINCCGIFRVNGQLWTFTCSVIQPWRL